MLPHADAVAPAAALAFSVHLLDAVTHARVPPVGDVLRRTPGARLLVLLDVCPSPPQLAVFANVTSGARVPTAAVLSYLRQPTQARPSTPRSCWTRSEGALAVPPPSADAVVARVRGALAFQPHLLGGAPRWPSVPPHAYDSAALLSNECRAVDWKSASSWLSGDGASGASLEERDAASIMWTSFDYAAALLNQPGGGEVVFGVWDTGGVEGVVSAPSSAMAATLEAGLRTHLSAALVPWRDEWVRVVAVPVMLRDRALLRASAWR